MKAHRRRRLAELVHQRFVVKISLHQGGEMTILNAAAQLMDFAAHLADVFVRLRHEVGDVERPFLSGPDLLDDELEIVLVILDASAPLSGRAAKMSRVAFHIRPFICPLRSDTIALM